MLDGPWTPKLTPAELSRRIVELRAFAKMAPTVRARNELTQLVKFYERLVGQSSEAADE